MKRNPQLDPATKTAFSAVLYTGAGKIATASRSTFAGIFRFDGRPRSLWITTLTPNAPAAGHQPVSIGLAHQ